MPLVHSIRLKGPWQYEWLDPCGSYDFESIGKCTMPCSWESAFGQIPGTVKWSRRFQRPTNLDDNERVKLTVFAVSGIRSVHLNGELVAEGAEVESGFQLDVTSLLNPSNEMTVVQEYDGAFNAEQAGLCQPVFIAIHQVAE